MRRGEEGEGRGRGGEERAGGGERKEKGGEGRGEGGGEGRGGGGGCSPMTQSHCVWENNPCAREVFHGQANLRDPRPYVPTRSQHEKARSHSEAVEFSGVLIFGCHANEGPASFSPKINVALSAASDVSRLPERRVPPCIESYLPSPGTLWFHLGLRKQTAAAS